MERLVHLAHLEMIKLAIENKELEEKLEAFSKEVEELDKRVNKNDQVTETINDGMIRELVNSLAEDEKTNILMEPECQCHREYRAEKLRRRVKNRNKDKLGRKNKELKSPIIELNEEFAALQKCQCKKEKAEKEYQPDKARGSGKVRFRKA